MSSSFLDTSWMTRDLGRISVCMNMSCSYGGMLVVDIKRSGQCRSCGKPLRELNMQREDDGEVEF